MSKSAPGSPETPLDSLKRATTATIRAIAGRPELAVTYAAKGRGLTARGLRLPTPSADLPADEVAILRGKADHAAARLRHHNTELHLARRPVDVEAAAVFDSLEQVRCEVLGARHMKGIARNLAASRQAFHREQGYCDAKTAQDIPVSEAVATLARQIAPNMANMASDRGILELWRPNFGPALGNGLSGLLAELLENVHDQKAFAEQSLKILSQLDLGSGDGDNEAQDEKTDGQDADAQSQKSDQSSGQQEEKPELDSDLVGADGGEKTGEQELKGQGESKDGGVKDTAGAQARSPEYNSQQSFSSLSQYLAFTTDYDEVIEAEGLCEQEELQGLRELLDRQMTNLQGVIAKLANRLQRRLMAQQTRSWEFNLEEGLLDSSRLTRVVVDPVHSLSFKRESESNFKDTLVTLLIDNSGSMRGRPIMTAAASADILARTLERCGVKVEILGFTTRLWKGGQSRELWTEQGKPGCPGRLNDLRHIIYKSADTPMRRSRKNLGLMLREGLLKENIDGEALLWAYNRLLARHERRRILMVISDGAPVDDSTLSVNPGNFLENHLREVIARIEKESPIELLAIGIGHDVTRYYQHAVTINDVEQLGGIMTKKLAELFVEKTSTATNRSGHSRHLEQ